MVSKCFRKQGEMLKRLKRMRPKAMKATIKSANRQLVNALCEGSVNVLKGNVPMTPYQKRRLRRYKKDLRALVNRKVSVKRKKTVLQKGGFLSALLPPLIGVLGSLFTR